MKYLSFLFVLSTLVSCAQLDYNIPTSRMDGPETTGGLGQFDVAIGVASGYDVDLAEGYDFIISGTTTDESVSGPEPLLTFKGNVGLLPRLDIGLQTYPDTSDLLKVKYQFIGGDRKTVGLKMSVQGEFGFGYHEDGSLNTDSTVYTTDLKAKSLGASLNIGYRVNPSMLFYLNTVFMEYKVDGVLKDGATVSYDGQQSPEVILVLPGIRFDFDSAYVQVETGYSFLNSSYEDRNSDDFTYGLSLGYTF
ncbi:MULTISPECIES: hypothetical protein [unclassified Halobacteriovorax]|uniref:hypothetical protein n=1 Tax=unclassified Halobacteriovorax TaxID=2639665 RepID=UPI00399A50D2